MRGFNLYRQSKTGNYAAEILNPETGQRICYRSTMTKNRDEALIIVSGWLQDGIPERKRGRIPVYKKPEPQTLEAVSSLTGILKIIENIELDTAGALRIAEVLRNRGLLSLPATDAKRGSIEFITYLKNFFDYEKSAYVREKLAHGQSIGRGYCMEATRRIERFWAPQFQGRQMASITRKDLKDFSLHIAGMGYSSYHLNSILKAGTVPLGYAAQEGFIPSNPAAGLKMYSNNEQKRGCLTPQEVEMVFSHYWKDKAAYAGNALAMTTGLRLGEVLAISKNDIDIEKNVLHIRHS
ncbi:MAG: hypothetical protein LBU88_05480 [Treponema sp.]|jgi:hypothetical protein|nr:hypothetical protein [Treponema sp.]